MLSAQNVMILWDLLLLFFIFYSIFLSLLSRNCLDVSQFVVINHENCELYDKPDVPAVSEYSKRKL